MPSSNKRSSMSLALASAAGLVLLSSPSVVVDGFSAVTPPSTTSSVQPSLSSSSDAPTTTTSNDLPKSKAVKYSQSIPFLKCPTALVDCQYAGNVGFDPLNLSAGSTQLLKQYREAEIKHARLAMLAAVGWPISELYDQTIAETFGWPSVLDLTTNTAPSLLTGGLEQFSPAWWGFCVGLTAAIDMYSVSISQRNADNPNYVPGDLGFDPLNLYPSDADSQLRMQLAEIKHGRLAMLAIFVYATEESVTNIGVVDETPFLFASSTVSTLFSSLP